MNRREFMTLVGGAAAWPLAAHGQQPAMPVIGFLHSEAPGRYTSPILRAFRQGLSESGHVEGRNVAIEYRWAESRYDRLPDLAGDLVGRGVKVIIANGPAIEAAKTATTTIPIVFFAGGDPVKLGLVTSLAQPGGNLTGVTNLGTELGPKRLELLHELVPAATSFAVLVNPTYPDAAAQSEAAGSGPRSIAAARCFSCQRRARLRFAVCSARRRARWRPRGRN
jgi:putative ABC transport system substrate-binding protein